MKTLIFFICTLMGITGMSFAQELGQGNPRASEEPVNLQGVARGADMMPMPDKEIRLRCSVVDDKNMDVYIESKLLMTNSIGQFVYPVGTGDPEFGTWIGVDWDVAFRFKIQADFTGGTSYTDFGSIPVHSVPRAKYAIKTDKADSAEVSAKTLSYEEKQLLSFRTELGTAGLDGILGITNSTEEEVLKDLDPDNELQTFSFNPVNHLLSITDNYGRLNQTVDLTIPDISPWRSLGNEIRYGGDQNYVAFSSGFQDYRVVQNDATEVYINRDGISFGDYYSSSFFGLYRDYYNGRSVMESDDIFTDVVTANIICADTIKVEGGIFVADKPNQQSILRATQSYFTRMAIQNGVDDEIVYRLTSDPDYLYKVWQKGDDEVKRMIMGYAAGLFTTEIFGPFGPGPVAREFLSEHGSRYVQLRPDGTTLTSSGYDENEPECSQISAHDKNGAALATMAAIVSPFNPAIFWGIMAANEMIIRNTAGVPTGWFQHSETMGGSVINCFYLFGSVKNFVAEHPEAPDKKIVYASIEGPEAAMYNRGTAQLVNGEVFIPYEEHFRLMLVEGSETITLTPRSANTYGLAVIETTTEGFRVKELMNGTGDFSFDWRVEGVRKGYENYRVVRDEETLIYQTNEELAKYRASQNGQK